MFLKSLHLINIRCFKDIKLDFTKEDGANRQWTILVGENGTGKSTLLKAAAIVTCGSDALAELIGDPSDWIRLNEKTGEIHAVLENQKGDEREINIEIHLNDTLSDVIARCKETLAPLDDALEHSDRNYFVVGYGASRRLSTFAGFEKRGGRYGHIRARSIATLFDPDTMLNPLESWAIDLDYQHQDEGVDTVRNTLNKFLPRIKFDHIDKKTKQLLFKTPDGIVPLSQLSDGYQNVAAWIGDLLFRVTNIFEDYTAPLNARGLLIIDEVDLHLHPNWQRSLNDFLKKRLPNMQFLVTTHSAITTQQASAHQVHYFKRRGKTVSLFRMEADPSLMLINQLLISEAFGLETDESLLVEKEKDRYRSLRDSKELSRGKRSEMKKLQSKLQNVVKGGAEAMGLMENQSELLKRIEKELKSRK